MFSNIIVFEHPLLVTITNSISTSALLLGTCISFFLLVGKSVSRSTYGGIRLVEPEAEEVDQITAFTHNLVERFDSSMQDDGEPLNLPQFWEMVRSPQTAFQLTPA